MLVLNRRKGDGVVIEIPGHDPVVILVREIHQQQVKLSFHADRAISILRTELRGRLRTVNQIQEVVK